MANTRNYSNTAVSTTLNGAITSGTSVVLNSQTGMPSTPFLLVLEPDSANEEIVLVNSGSGTSGSPYVVVRGQDGTSNINHANGVVVQHRISAIDFTDSRTHEATASGVHALQAGISVIGSNSSITSAITVANTLTETTISKTFSLGGNIALAGDHYRINAYGSYGNTATPTMTFKIKYGSTVLGSGVVSLVSGTSGSWFATGYITFQSVGASGNLTGLVWCNAQSASGNYMGINTAGQVTGISTTGAQTLSMSVTWSAASGSNTISALGSNVEQLA